MNKMAAVLKGQVIMGIKTGITGEELKKLRSAVGWVDVSVEQLQRAVDHSMVTVGVYEDGEIIGCGRLIGDFSCKSKLTDIIVLPEHQRKGYGRMIVQRIFDEAEKKMSDGEYLSIGADPTPGHLDFYKYFGMEDEGEMAVTIWLKK